VRRSLKVVRTHQTPDAIEGRHMSMDPDGTNRIIQQQIKEWHAFQEGERNAKLLEGEPAPPNPRSSIRTLARQMASAIAWPLSAIRQRLAQKPVA
jgi:hypothetical protein